MVAQQPQDRVGPVLPARHRRVARTLLRLRLRQVLRLSRLRPLRLLRTLERLRLLRLLRLLWQCLTRRERLCGLPETLGLWRLRRLRPALAETRALRIKWIVRLRGEWIIRLE